MSEAALPLPQVADPFREVVNPLRTVADPFGKVADPLPNIVYPFRKVAIPFRNIVYRLRKVVYRAQEPDADPVVITPTRLEPSDQGQALRSKSVQNEVRGIARGHPLDDPRDEESRPARHNQRAVN